MYMCTNPWSRAVNKPPFFDPFITECCWSVRSVYLSSTGITLEQFNFSDISYFVSTLGVHSVMLFLM